VKFEPVGADRPMRNIDKVSVVTEHNDLTVPRCRRLGGRLLGICCRALARRAGDFFICCVQQPAYTSRSAATSLRRSSMRPEPRALLGLHQHLD
jgi:hypothetical protein